MIKSSLQPDIVDWKRVYNGPTRIFWHVNGGKLRMDIELPDDTHCKFFGLNRNVRARAVERFANPVIAAQYRPIARILPMSEPRSFPDHADLRQRMARLQTPSADLIRAERDER